MIPKKKKDLDITNRIVGAISEEAEKVGESIANQITGEGTSQQMDPIVEAMEQKTHQTENIHGENIGESEKTKENVKKMRSFIERREELENELKEIQKKALEQEKQWHEQIQKQFTIINPGASMEQTNLPLSTKPKRGQMPGRPGTARGETGPEVRKSKQ